MSSYDLVVILLFAFAAFKGFRKGLIRELAGLLGFFIALYFAWHWMGDLGSFLQKLMNGGVTAIPVISFALLFAVLVAGFSLFARFATKLLDLTLVFGLVNRVAGAFVAVFQVFLIVLVVTWIADRTSLITEKVKKEAFLYPLMAGSAPALYHFSEIFFPESEEWMDSFNENIARLKGRQLEKNKEEESD